MLKTSSQNLNILLDGMGIEKAWYSILATYIHRQGNPALDYILKEKEFKAVPLQDYDYLEDLSVGEISVLYEYSLAHVDHDKRKEEGQYFTPDDVAQLMAKRALDFPADKVWLDPCSGIGNLSFWLIYFQKNPEKFLKENLYLVDRDALALLIARVILTVKFQKKSPKLFSDIAPRFITDDFLSPKSLPRFDYAILNPPYVMVDSDKRFETAEARDLYAYFLERVAKLSKGFISITPQTFTNGKKFESLRRILIKNFNSLSIYCFDNVPDNIFRGVKFGSTNTNKVNSTRAGIIVARSDDAKAAFRITPLLRWRTSQRAELLSSVDDYLADFDPTPEIFPKIQKNLSALYKQVKKEKRTLAHILSQHSTLYKLTVPSTPRYFISALKQPVERTSFRTLYFYNETDRNIAYLLINSSYMYWWWRINDGGMTISEKTLLSLPIPASLQVSADLIKKLEKSESENKVFKKNAGKINENVKHDITMVRALNESIFPLYCENLINVHNNSVLA